MLISTMQWYYYERSLKAITLSFVILWHLWWPSVDHHSKLQSFYISVKWLDGLCTLSSWLSDSSSAASLFSLLHCNLPLATVSAFNTCTTCAHDCPASVCHVKSTMVFIEETWLNGCYLACYLTITPVFLDTVHSFPTFSWHHPT